LLDEGAQRWNLVLQRLVVAKEYFEQDLKREPKVIEDVPQEHAVGMLLTRLLVELESVWEWTKEVTQDPSLLSWFW